MHGNDHHRSEYWLFLGKERKEGEGEGDFSLMTCLLKKDEEQAWKMVRI